jgi:hypothetical protein
MKKTSVNYKRSILTAKIVKIVEAKKKFDTGQCYQNFMNSFLELKLCMHRFFFVLVVWAYTIFWRKKIGVKAAFKMFVRF